MALKLFTLLLLICLAMCQPNYQERSIYYSESDNVCQNGLDKISLTVNIDNKDTIKNQLSGKSLCNYWQVGAAMIRPANSTVFSDPSSGTEIKFAQESTYKKSGSQVDQIIQKVTVINPAKIKNSSYNCVILGDGKVQNFGINEGQPSASIYLRCLLSQQSKDMQINHLQTEETLPKNVENI